jgi:SMI1 / KNR4 family (SUKH-1)
MDWLERLKIQAHDPNRAVENYVRRIIKDNDGNRILPTANPTASIEDLNGFENESGLKIPKDLRRVYLEVGNGRFGPGYGLSRIVPTRSDNDRWSMLDLYINFRDNGLYGEDNNSEYIIEWSNYLFPFCAAGCDLLGVVDVRDEKVGFLQYEMPANIKSVESIIEWRAESVQDWFEAWMDGAELMTYSHSFFSFLIDTDIIKSNN